MKRKSRNHRRISWVVGIFSILSGAALSASAFAGDEYPPEPIQAQIYLDFYGAAAFTTTPIAGSAMPFLAQYLGGATIAFQFGGQDGAFLMGGSSDYRLINQMSDADASLGNLRGTRWNMFSPMIGTIFGAFLIKGDFQFTGDYTLTNLSSTGGTVSYKRPLGGRLSVLYHLAIPFNNVYVGAYFETLYYQYRSDSSVPGDTALSSPGFNIWQAGATLAVVF